MSTTALEAVTVREVYPGAPIVLATLEVRHPSAPPLSKSGQLRVKQRLDAWTPIMRQVRLSALGPMGAADMMNESFPKFLSRDKTTSVSFRSESIVVETTRYIRFERLRDLTLEALTIRHEIGGMDGVERIGLRYIDEVRVPELEGSAGGWAQWINASLLGPAITGETLGLISSQWQGVVAFESGPESNLVLRYGPRNGYAFDSVGDLKRPTPIPGPFFLLDIDSYWTEQQEVPEFDPTWIVSKCDTLHTPVRQLFESVITDRLRNEVFRAK